VRIILAAPRRLSVWFWAALFLVGLGAGWTAWQGTVPFAAFATRRPSTPAEARQRQLLDANIGHPGDPDLDARFQKINAQHFSGALPAIPIRWEPGLAGVGPLMGPEITLQGMFGRIGRREVILLNPSVRDDGQALDRALCHEMVHAYLFATGEEHTAHGPAFQAVLQRLSLEHAFEGIAADPATRDALHKWLEAESARLDTERREMDVLDRALKEDGAALNHQIETFNGQPERPGADAQVLDARREQFNQQLAELNLRLGRMRDDLAHFNAEVARYNLMITYPDGLDDSETIYRSRAYLISNGQRN